MESFNEEKQKIQQSIYLEFFSLPWIVRLRFPKSNFEADHQHLLDRKVFYVDMLDILHRVPSATCSLRFCFPSPTLPMPSVHHSVPRFSARMVYRDYESMEEQSVFEKDPSKQDTSTQSPLPQEKMSGLPWYGGYCFISACNLGCRWLQVWTKTWNSRAHYRACFHACPGYDSEFSPFFVCTWLCVGLQSIWCCSFPFMVYIWRFQRKVRYARILLTRGIYIYLK